MPRGVYERKKKGPEAASPSTNGAASPVETPVLSPGVNSGSALPPSAQEAQRTSNATHGTSGAAGGSPSGQVSAPSGAPKKKSKTKVKLNLGQAASAQEFIKVGAILPLMALDAGVYRASKQKFHLMQYIEPEAISECQNAFKLALGSAAEVELGPWQFYGVCLLGAAAGGAFAAALDYASKADAQAGEQRAKSDPSPPLVTPAYGHSPTVEEVKPDEPKPNAVTPVASGGSDVLPGQPTSSEVPTAQAA